MEVTNCYVFLVSKSGYCSSPETVPIPCVGSEIEMRRESLFWLALLTDVTLSVGEHTVICTMSGTRHLSETIDFL
jgi:hypothetical protein